MKPTVLLVDDEQRVTAAMKRALRQEPFEILSATSGQEALSILEEHSVDVVVADERMPGMSGLEFLREVQRRHPSTVRIMLTGHATLDNAIQAINECQIHRFFTKPYAEAALAEALRKAIEHKQMAQDAQHMIQLLNSGLDWGDSLIPPQAPASETPQTGTAQTG